eukprot:1161140-Pelagomonas_calceolata.AAC.18
MMRTTTTCAPMLDAIAEEIAQLNSALANMSQRQTDAEFQRSEISKGFSIAMRSLWANQCYGCPEGSTVHQGRTKTIATMFLQRFVVGLAELIGKGGCAPKAFWLRCVSPPPYTMQYNVCIELCASSTENCRSRQCGRNHLQAQLKTSKESIASLKGQLDVSNRQIRVLDGEAGKHQAFKAGSFPWKDGERWAFEAGCMPS